jgi:cell division protein FtsZ
VHSFDKDLPREESKAPQFRVDKVQEDIEPVLVNKENPEPVENIEERTFEFSLEDSSENALNNEESTEKTIYNLDDQAPEDPMDEQLRKSRDRISKLKALSYRLGSNANINDMEKEPAYKRKNVKLDNVPHSSESDVSRFTLSTDEEKKNGTKAE